MRYFGTRAVNVTPPPSDTKLSLLLTAGSAQAFDWPATCDMFRVSLCTTAASLQAMAFMDFASTGAAVATTGGAITTATSGGVLISGNYDRIYERPRSSTGFSVIAGSSFNFCMEFWSRAGTTG